MTQHWNQASLTELKKVKGICLDIDETLSTRGKLTAEAYQALWDLKKNGFRVVPITGRPAGWCDHFARFWPVDAVIGENGAFSFYMDGKKRVRLDTPMGRLKPDQAQKKLKALSQKILTRFPGAVWASDQPYREFDLAIDICEDVKPWSEDKINELLEFCKEQGAHAKLSSIHVNTWYGDYDKHSGFTHWLGHVGASLKMPKEQEWLFIGDSPNDEPLFKKFQFSVGVSNLKKYLDRLEFPPTWVAESESGSGFVEMTKRMILAHSS